MPTTVVLVGNKCDLESKRRVEKEVGETKATEWGCTFLEASAKTRLNVEETFHTLVRKIWVHDSQPATTTGGENNRPSRPSLFKKCVLF